MSVATAKALQMELMRASSTLSGFPTPMIPDEKKLIIIDTGASVTITNSATEFTSPPRFVQHTQLKGIASGLTARGIGTALYTFKDDDGFLFQIVLHNVLFVPELPI
jgi:hypothetical protein